MRHHECKEHLYHTFCRNMAMFAARATGPRDCRDFFSLSQRFSSHQLLVPMVQYPETSRHKRRIFFHDEDRAKCITHRITICMPAGQRAGKAVKCRSRHRSVQLSRCRSSATLRCAGLCRGLSTRVRLLDGSHPHRQWTTRCMLGLTDRP